MWRGGGCRETTRVVFLFVTARGIDTRIHVVSIGLIALALALVVGTIWELLSGAPEIAAVALAWCYLALAFRAAFLRRRASGHIVAA